VICGIDELHAHAGCQARYIVSILDPGTPEPAAFAHFAQHERLTLTFHDIIEPMDGMVLPQPEHMAEVLRFGRTLGRDGLETLLVHCHAGISRSTAAAVALLAQAYPKADGAALFAQIERTRPQAWPNSLMVAFADKQLGRRGQLVAALKALYARRLASQPRLGDDLRAGGRGTEVTTALGSHAKR
jgi:predicted protein tyrosine phosphatase